MISRIYLVHTVQEVATKLQSADWCHCSVATADRALEIAESLV